MILAKKNKQWNFYTFKLHHLKYLKVSIFFNYDNKQINKISLLKKQFKF